MSPVVAMAQFFALFDRVSSERQPIECAMERVYEVGISLLVGVNVNVKNQDSAQLIPSQTAVNSPRLSPPIILAGAQLRRSIGTAVVSNSPTFDDDAG